MNKRAPATLVVVVALAVAGAVGALALGTSTGIDTLVSSSNPDYRATQAHARQFGADPIVVLVREPLGTLLAPAALETVSRLEACLGGEQLRFSSAQGALIPVAASVAKPYGGAGSPCGRLMAARMAQVVYGPGTFLNRAVVAVADQISSLTAGAASVVRRAETVARRLARARGLDAAGVAAAVQAAGKLALERQIGSLGKVAQRAALSGAPSISDTAFLREIVFGSGGSAPQPSPRFSYLFPNADTSLIQVRLRAGLSDRRQAQAISWIRQAVAMKQFRLPGGSYVVTGEPVVLNDLAGQVGGQVLLLLVGAVAVMGLVLLLVFRRRPRLLPLAIAGAAVAITLGLPAVTGMSLTIASIAVLPVLIGLGVDYGIQLQSGTRPRAIAVAALATAAGCLVLLLSPVPMVRGFALLLAIGIAIAMACALAAVPAVRSVTGQLRPRGLVRRVRVEKVPPVGSFSTRTRGRRLIGRAAAALTASVVGAGELLAAAASRLRPTDRLSPLLRALTLHPRRVLLVATLLAAAGWALDTQIGVQSDLTKLVPQSMPALRHLRTLERTTGVSGEIDVLVHASDAATPTALSWMVSYEDRVVTHFGYSATGGCRTARLCPALSLPDLFPASGASLTAAAIDSLLASVPPYFSRAVLTANRRYASLAFGIRLMPLAEQRRVIDYMRARLHPPAGVSASLSGLPVLAADADRSLSSPVRRLLTLLAGLVAVGLTLLVVFRDLRRALVPFAPIVLASGWSALILWAIHVPLNPMSATLGVLVIAVATEFSVVIAERVRQERLAATAQGAQSAVRLLRTGQLLTAVERAYRSTGAAVLASAITATAGFGVLVLSNIAMLRQFGWVTVVDLVTALVGVLFVLPAVLALVDRLPPARARLTADDARKPLETVA